MAWGRRSWRQIPILVNVHVSASTPTPNARNARSQVSSLDFLSVSTATPQHVRATVATAYTGRCRLKVGVADAPATLATRRRAIVLRAPLAMLWSHQCAHCARSTLTAAAQFMRRTLLLFQGHVNARALRVTIPQRLAARRALPSTWLRRQAVCAKSATKRCTATVMHSSPPGSRPRTANVTASMGTRTLSVRCAKMGSSRPARSARCASPYGTAAGTARPPEAPMIARHACATADPFSSKKETVRSARRTAWGTPPVVAATASLAARASACPSVSSATTSDSVTHQLWTNSRAR